MRFFMSKAIVSLFVLLSSSVTMASTNCLIEVISMADVYFSRTAELTLEVKENTDLASYVLRTREYDFDLSVVLVDGRYIASITKGDSSATVNVEGELNLSLRKGSTRLSVTCPGN